MRKLPRGVDSKERHETESGAHLRFLHFDREKLLAKTRAIKVLDFALQTNEGTENCLRFVEALGLKTLFAAFMGKVSRIAFVDLREPKALSLLDLHGGYSFSFMSDNPHCAYCH